jgi:hypothetical protein
MAGVAATAKPSQANVIFSFARSYKVISAINA